jgi:hypothetical protein
LNLDVLAKTEKLQTAYMELIALKKMAKKKDKKDDRLDALDEKLMQDMQRVEETKKQRQLVKLGKLQLSESEASGEEDDDEEAKHADEDQEFDPSELVEEQSEEIDDDDVKITGASTNEKEILALADKELTEEELTEIALAKLREEAELQKQKDAELAKKQQQAEVQRKNHERYQTIAAKLAAQKATVTHSLLSSSTAAVQAITGTDLRPGPNQVNVVVTKTTSPQSGTLTNVHSFTKDGHQTTLSAPSRIYERKESKYETKTYQLPGNKSITVDPKNLTDDKIPKMRDELFAMRNLPGADKIRALDSVNIMAKYPLDVLAEIDQEVTEASLSAKLTSTSISSSS